MNSAALSNNVNELRDFVFKIANDLRDPYRRPRTVARARASASYSTALRCLPEMPARVSPISAAGSSRTTGWKRSSPFPTSCFQHRHLHLRLDRQQSEREEPPRPIEEIEAKIQTLEAEIATMLAKVTR